MTKDRDLARERLLFGILLCLQAAVTLWLILSRRMVKTHDTFSIYQLQYYFLAHAVHSSDPALWLPYSVHGVLTHWYAAFQGGLLQNILLLFGGVAQGTNLVPWFYAGMFLDDFILLLGVWSLGHRYYSSSWTRFIVAAAAVGSSFWASQIHFNLKNFYAIPLILSLLHGYLEQGKRRDLLFAGVLLALQFTGNIPYMSVFTALVVGAYLATHALLFRRVWVERLKSLRHRPSDLSVLLAGALLLGVLYLGLSDGTSATRLFRTGRNPDGTVGLDSFLTYAATVNPMRYLDLLLGISPSMDYTLYAGVGVPVLAFVALVLRPSKQVLHLLVCAVLVLMFSAGYLSLVGPMAYEALLPLRFFRYLGFVAPLVKLFLILISGFAIDALLQGRVAEGPSFQRACTGVAVALGGLAMIDLVCATTTAGRDLISDLLRAGTADVANRPSVLGTFPAAILAGTGLAALTFAMLIFMAARGSIRRERLILLIVLVQVLDVFRWKVQMLREETVVLDDRQYAMHQIRPLPFITRRLDYTSSERYRTLEPVFFDYGARYDLADGFVHLDPPVSRFSIGYWLAPFEALVQAHDRRPVAERIARRASLTGLGPHDPYSKAIGMTEDKVQIFRRAHVGDSDQAIADFMNDPSFKGDVLLLSPRPGSPAADLAPALLTADERIRTRIAILQFDGNSVTMGVTLPPAETGGGWLTYCDVWDPGWTATVNGKPATVERSFLAYKAVRLEPGVNVLHLRFHSPVRTWSYRLVYLASFLGVLALLVHAVPLFFPRTSARSAGSPVS